MTTTTQTGAYRPQYNPEPNAYARTAAHGSYVAQPNRNAEDPFSAANGTLRFSSERKATAAAAKSTSSQSRTGASRSSNTGAKRTTSSGSSAQPPKRRRRKKKNKRLILFAVGFLLFALLALIGAILALRYFACGGRERCEAHDPAGSAEPGLTTPAPADDDTVITANATIAGVPVQNLTVQNARTALTQKLEQAKNSVQITVSYDDYSTTLNAENLKLAYAGALEEALKDAAGGASGTLSVPFSFDADALRSVLYTLNEQIPNSAKNAWVELCYEDYKIDDVTYHKPYFMYHEGVRGAQLNYDSVEQEVRAALDAGNYTAALTPEVAVSEPDITADMLRSQISLLSTYSTNYRFKGSSSTSPDVAENCMARDHNISKAVSMMQFTELAPGKSFSFNNTTGERSEQKDWWLANAVYQGSGYRKESGGGVCQVSTTMFNALLRAGVKTFVQRWHSIPSNYVTTKFEDGLGFDATVDYGHIDFKFTNDTGHKLYMLVYITKDKTSGRRKFINVEIWGQEQPGVEYKCYNEIIEKILAADQPPKETKDKSMLEGTTEQISEGHDGYTVNIYVDMYKDGVKVKQNYTDTAIYKVSPPEVRVGTAKATPEPTPKPTNTPKPTDAPEEPGGEP